MLRIVVKKLVAALVVVLTQTLGVMCLQRPIKSINKYFMLSKRDDPTVGTERFLSAALQELTSVINSELEKQRKSGFEEPKSLDQVAPSYQKLIIIANLGELRAGLRDSVDLQPLEELEKKTITAFIDEQNKAILPWVLQDLQKGVSIVYRLLRELSQVDRQISEIDVSFARQLLTLLVTSLLKALSQVVVGKGKQAHIDGLIVKSVLASLISEDALESLDTFLKNNHPQDDESPLEDGGQRAIDDFKQKNPILVSIFTY